MLVAVTSPACSTVLEGGCGETRPSALLSAAIVVVPLTSPIVLPSPGQPSLTSISSIRYSGATSTTPVTWGCSASRAISAPLDL